MEDILKETLASLNISKIRSYLSTEDTKENLLALGKIFAVLGNNVQALLSNVPYRRLIRAYIDQFPEDSTQRLLGEIVASKGNDSSDGSGSTDKP